MSHADTGCKLSISHSTVSTVLKVKAEALEEVKNIMSVHGKVIRKWDSLFLFVFHADEHIHKYIIYIFHWPKCR